MNTPALVARMNNNTLPQWSPTAPGYIAMHSGSEADQSRAASRLMGAVRRFWWIVALIWAVLAIPASIYIYKTIPPQYLAINYISVAPVVQNPVNGDSRPNPFYTEYLHTQAELIKDPHVLKDAADNDVRLKQFDFFRQLPDQVTYLMDHVEVMPIGATQNISISMTHQNAVFAKAVVDSVMDAYFRQRNNLDSQSLEGSLKIVKELQKTTAQSLRDAQDKLRSLTSDGDMVWSDEDQKVLVDVISNAKQTLGQLQSKEIDIQSQLADIKSRKLPDSAVYQASVPVDGDPQIQQWTVERNRVLIADSVLASKHATLDHPDRVEYRKQLKVLDGKIAARTAELRSNAWTAYMAKDTLDRTQKVNDLNATLTGLQQQIAALQKHVDQQESLAKDLGTKEQPIVALKEQITDSKEALKRYNDRIEEIENINRAPGRVTSGGETVQPRTPKVDKRPKLIFAANGIGLLVGLGVLVLLMKLRDKIEGADDLREHYQPLIVGTVSHAGSAARGLHGRMSRKILGEEMRLLHANLLPPGPTQRRIMMVTSPTPSNGKTSIASQLALSLAKSGMEVLLIDADLRKRDLSTMFDVGFRPGLSDLLQGKTPELIRPVELLPNLRLMGAGSKLERNPVELFQRKHFTESLNLLQDKFDCVVVDTPPTLVVADARLIARSCDEVLCVVRAQVSSQKDVDQTVDALQRVTGKTPKIIVNGVAHRQSYYKYKFAYSSDAGNEEVEASTAAATSGTDVD